MSDDNIIHLHGETYADIPAERVLEAALSHGMETCIVVGYDGTGGFYFASSTGDGPELVWMLERAKMELLSE